MVRTERALSLASALGISFEASPQSEDRLAWARVKQRIPGLGAKAEIVVASVRQRQGEGRETTGAS